MKAAAAEELYDLLEGVAEEPRVRPCIAVRQRGSPAAWRFGSVAVRQRGNSAAWRFCSLAVRHGQHREAARGHGWLACGSDCCMPCVFLLAPVPAAVEVVGAQVGVLGGFDPAAVADDVRYW